MSILEEESIHSWLNEFSNARTKKSYSQRIERFFNATDTSPKTFKELDANQIKRLVLSYQKREVAKGASNNAILSNITAVRSYCASINKPLKFRRGKLVNLEADTSSHVFSNGDLKLLFEVGNTFEKALLSTAVSEGWEISSFLEQDRETIQRLLDHAKQDNENFIFFENTRKKTGVLRCCVLNPLSIEWLTKYLETRKDDDHRLFPITQDGVQKMLYRLAEISGLKATGNLRFHKIRSWLMSRLSRAGFNEFQIKFIIGHSIALQDRAYLNTLTEEIREKYPRVYNDYLNIYYQPSTDSTKLHAELEQRMAAINSKIETLKRENFDLKFTLELLGKELAKGNVDFNVIEALNTVTKTVEYREQYNNDMYKEWEREKDRLTVLRELQKEYPEKTEAISRISELLSKKEKEQRT